MFIKVVVKKGFYEGVFRIRDYFIIWGGEMVDNSL